MNGRRRHDAVEAQGLVHDVLQTVAARTVPAPGDDRGNVGKRYRRPGTVLTVLPSNSTNPVRPRQTPTMQTLPRQIPPHMIVRQRQRRHRPSPLRPSPPQRLPQTPHALEISTPAKQHKETGRSEVHRGDRGTAQTGLVGMEGGGRPADESGEDCGGEDYREATVGGGGGRWRGEGRVRWTVVCTEYSVRIMMAKIRSHLRTLR